MKGELKRPRNKLTFFCDFSGTTYAQWKWTRWHWLTGKHPSNICSQRRHHVAFRAPGRGKIPLERDSHKSTKSADDKGRYPGSEGDAIGGRGVGGGRLTWQMKSGGERWTLLDFYISGTHERRNRRDTRRGRGAREAPGPGGGRGRSGDARILYLIHWIRGRGSRLSVSQRRPRVVYHRRKFNLSPALLLLYVAFDIYCRLRVSRTGGGLTGTSPVEIPRTKLITCAKASRVGKDTKSGVPSLQLMFSSHMSVHRAIDCVSLTSLNNL